MKRFYCYVSALCLVWAGIVREQRCAGLSRRQQTHRGACRGRIEPYDARREGGHAPCPVQVFVTGSSAPGYSRGVVFGRPSRYPRGGALGRVGRCRLDQRLLHGFSCADMPCGVVGSVDVGHLRQGHRRGGALPQQDRASGARRQHLPYAAQRPQFRIYG